MQRKQAIKLFKEEVFPNWKKETDCTVRCAFLDWTDSLHKNGEITEKQWSNWSWNGGKA